MHNLSEIKISGLDESCVSEVKLDLYSEFCTKNQNPGATGTLTDFSKLNFDITKKTFNNDIQSLYKITNPYLLLLGGKPDFITRKYDLENNKWTEDKKLTVNKSDFSALLYKDNKIIVLGGKAIVLIILNIVKLM